MRDFDLPQYKRHRYFGPGGPKCPCCRDTRRLGKALTRVNRTIRRLTRQLLKNY